MAAAPPIPLSGWADRTIGRLARLSASPRIAALSGRALLGERAHLSGFLVPGRRSAGGGCLLFDTRDDPVALNLSRPDDRALLPALFASEALDPGTEASICGHMARAQSGELVARGREMGLAIAGVCEPDGGASPPVERQSPTLRGAALKRPPRVVDLSSLWAGPLAGHLLWLSGAEVIKVESTHRPDGMRRGCPAFFDRLNQGKRSVVLDIRDSHDRAALVALLASSDIVIESARPRALKQIGIDADRLVREKPGLAWISITGHGVRNDAGQWVGFGDDCGVAGGLTAAMRYTTGQTAFVGDAVADPLTGMVAALVAYEACSTGQGGRYFLSMSSIAALALREETEQEPARVVAEFASWAAAAGQPFAPAPERSLAWTAPQGHDTASVLAEVTAC